MEIPFIQSVKLKRSIHRNIEISRNCRYVIHIHILISLEKKLQPITYNGTFIKNISMYTKTYFDISCITFALQLFCCKIKVCKLCDFIEYI